MKRAFRVAIVCLAAVVLCGLSTAQINFTQSAINSGDTATNAIANGDFNNDGILDLVTVNTGTLSFYKGLGGGKFANPANQTLPAYRGQIVVADFNRDGKLDLAIATSCCSVPGGVNIYLGNGDGTFTQGISISGNGSNAVSLALADFNGDHLPDLAVSFFSATTEILVGNGDGTFRKTAALSEGGYQVVAGDFNADGRQDVAMISGNNVAVFLGNGNGTFKGPLLASLSNVSFLAVGDFFNDRIQSLAALVTIYDGSGDYESDLYTLRYSGGMLLVGNKYVISAQTGDPYLELVGGDVNGDFKDDLFLIGGNFQGSAVSAYMLGNGNGTFQAPVPTLHWADLQYFPFIRDLNLDSRHDVGIAWTSIFENIGGEETLLNTNAKPNCAPPKANALSVHVCAPANGQVVGKTFTFKAAGNAWNGVAKRMELWIDGKKIGQNLEDQLNVTATLSRGAHTASFVTVDSFDEHVSGSVSFTSSY